MTVGKKVKYDGEKHLIVNVLADGSPVLVPMSVINDECFAVGLDELNWFRIFKQIKGYVGI